MDYSSHSTYSTDYSSSPRSPSPCLMFRILEEDRPLSRRQEDPDGHQQHKESSGQAQSGHQQQRNGQITGHTVELNYFNMISIKLRPDDPGLNFRMEKDREYQKIPAFSINPLVIQAGSQHLLFVPRHSTLL